MDNTIKILALGMIIGLLFAANAKLNQLEEINQKLEYLIEGE